MPNNPLLITGRLASRQDLYRALACCLLPRHRPAPTNLDGMADLLREARVRTVICAQWELPAADSRAVRAVLGDLGITLQR
ncbi:hypothetical protein MHT86_08560 [Corynebacterium mastitidis]|uniref:Uncharacterized protein n=1 Tax=Corynebacterium mastitidis TaxID=161890 RepID=A0A2N0X9U0_9CORY|nr:hypothetical protein [Corynebacterium mastitidis]MCH6197543.1 hypothetical protein [Corynebacterium mastitidis]PKF69451.1 hypothetical protein CXB45_02045 [Corynebacterium mastitidis]